MDHRNSRSFSVKGQGRGYATVLKTNVNPKQGIQTRKPMPAAHAQPTPSVPPFKTFGKAENVHKGQVSKIIGGRSFVAKGPGKGLKPLSKVPNSSWKTTDTFSKFNPGAHKPALGASRSEVAYHAPKRTIKSFRKIPFTSTSTSTSHLRKISTSLQLINAKSNAESIGKPVAKHQSKSGSTAQNYIKSIGKPVPQPKSGSTARSNIKSIGKPVPGSYQPKSGPTARSNFKSIGKPVPGSHQPQSGSKEKSAALRSSAPAHRPAISKAILRQPILKTMHKIPK